MTDDDKALVERLRNGVGYWMREKEIDGAPFDAADRIEAQAAEIARLREALKEYGDHKNYGDIPCRKDAWDFEIPCTCGLDDVLKENRNDRG